MNSTDLLQFIGIIAAFATFIGSHWIQEQRRRTDLLRERVEKLLEALTEAQRALSRFVQDFHTVDWTDNSKLGQLERYIGAARLGVNDFAFAMQQFQILDGMYFHAFQKESVALNRTMTMQSNAVERGDIDLLRKTLHEAMGALDDIQQRIIREHATLTKSTHMPSEL